ncbi:NAD(P)/FAD-dependent oxidoreductase [Williamsia deligens]|uniref:NAD(P)/FAD-dependent oxidoreductase n=1 Tax=Williamsia deligens TaxID=321325 RepID=A0ABW3GD41_9NOCA|nr:NAD(P)/FAD-dependent oxidoreductase [Williamsia deligens]MCP2195129.1 Pyridine nucleotide-disulfide oxidoreductase [Williamsia deligens]
MEPENEVIDVDYLVIGAGAVGMAFTDTILAETTATVALVDRYSRPGGHWNRAYPFVRLHQPSAFYGVNSLALGSGGVDTVGGNAGLQELASGPEVVSYFDQVLREEFLPTGRVHFLAGHDHTGQDVVSLEDGTRRSVRATKTVDARHSEVTVPSMRPPGYDVAEGVRSVAPNDLPTVADHASRFVVIGAGKTGVDACLWLLDAGVDPDAVRWVVPRDSWFLDRRTIQPVEGSFECTVGGYAAQLEASATATSVADLFHRLERAGQLLRLDPDVTPTMYRCATVTVHELDQLRTITGVVRSGHVRSIGLESIELDDGVIPTSPDVVHIDCTADGFRRRPAVPIFAGNTLTLQSVRTCQQVFSAALVAFVEATYDDDDATKNELCTVIPSPDSDIDWLRTTLVNTESTVRWGREPGITSWLEGARLNSVKTGLTGPPTPEQIGILKTIIRHMPGAITNLRTLLADTSADPGGL